MIDPEGHIRTFRQTVRVTTPGGWEMTACLTTLAQL